jgi:RNA polymerase sigma-70 factor, ECF subfamily
VGEIERQDDLVREAIARYGAALDRLARAYEADPDKRRDLSQEVQLAVWRSLERFEARCSLRTWIYRVAHNTAAKYIVRQRRTNLSNLSTLEEIEASADPTDHHRNIEEHIAIDRLLQLIHRLRPMDRQVMVLYLEDMDAESIGEISGISAGNVRVLIHRAKSILARQFHEGRPTWKTLRKIASGNGFQSCCSKRLHVVFHQGVCSLCSQCA